MVSFRLLSAYKANFSIGGGGWASLGLHELQRRQHYCHSQGRQ